MGCVSSLSVGPLLGSVSDGSSESSLQHSNRSEFSSVYWKVMPSEEGARQKFVEDGSLPQGDSDPEHVDLRVLLDDPLAQNALGRYANSIEVLDVFMCWVDIQEYKSIPEETVNYRRSKAMHIYDKYIKEDAVMKVTELTELGRKHYYQEIIMSQINPTSLQVDFFSELQQNCFTNISQDIRSFQAN